MLGGAAHDKKDPQLFSGLRSMNPSPTPESTLDFILATQIIVAWAGQGEGDAQHLGWWPLDMSEFGGQDFFQRVFPATSAWATLQSLREAAIREDTRLRESTQNPQQFRTLFYLGFDMDKRLESRLQSLKRSDKDPMRHLPNIARFIESSWDKEYFQDWFQGHGPCPPFAQEPVGRRLKGTPPESPELLIQKLTSALTLSAQYPMPHYQI